MKDHGMEFQEIELPSRDNYRGGSMPKVSV